MTSGVLALILLLAGPATPDRGGFEELTLNGVLDNPINLTEGRWEGEPFVEGGASRPRVDLADLVASGDLDGDGGDEAALLVTLTSGGSGVFVHLAVVAETDAGPRNVATTLIGDRVQIVGLEIVNGYVQLEYLAAAADDALCCPSLKTKRSFGLQSDELVEAYSEEVGPVSIADLENTNWQLMSLGAGQPVPDGIEVTVQFSGRNVSGSGGCNRYFTVLTRAAGRNLAIGPPASTRRACDQDREEVETRFFDALERVTDFGFTMGRLALDYESESGAERLVFWRRE